MAAATTHKGQSNGDTHQGGAGGPASVPFSPQQPHQQQQQQDRTYTQPQHAQNINSHQIPPINVGSTPTGPTTAEQQPPRIGGGSNVNIMARRTQPAPLFERLVTEEVQELKAYARIIENQNRRLADLERIHGDLETRLESESRGKIQLEATLEERERDWALKFRTLEKDRDHWKGVVKAEESKNDRLMAQVYRKEQDIQRMLQRKYDNQGEQRGNPSQSIRNVRHMSERVGNDRSQQDLQKHDRQFNSPHEILAASGSMEAVRIRNVRNLLQDFFGM